MASTRDVPEMKESLVHYLCDYTNDENLSEKETDEVVHKDCAKTVLASCFNASGPKTPVIQEDQPHNGCMRCFE